MVSPPFTEGHLPFRKHESQRGSLNPGGWIPRRPLKARQGCIQPESTGPGMDATSHARPAEASFLTKPPAFPEPSRL